ncbi:cytochrome c-type biogenesis protein CcmH [Haematobacter massiliensis]|uniref:Cytochrome c-type biogenesis protein n=1 Tax=Haematobacter massiliensis TaxID=195105 RepID=A0A086XZH3_9RHOB|nr:cytochrome c-type biogenesis protein [Haematobacter massiliensis]KFI27423.1 cytochrome C biogenesis protein CcdA [Haematobacter massiliensis]OWJ70814.1 cytochrome c-type biogenesis protein CcmH [Haematobacter massiliensis]OWJ84862.1 cytochrome c-type biogenesis protein CcmH [Haematobacter massiliensis]QBJ23843.1 cytochrome c-type biogenesis protein CcmH [Haematobacter massiliensis]
MRVLRLLVAVLLLAGPAFAVQPDEMLSDPALEARARQISQGLRCTQCRNENIDESNAGIARDLRLLVRERLVAGDSDGEVVDYVVDRYGEFVLLQPTVTGVNWVLWLAGPVMLLAAGGIAFAYVRRRSSSREQPEPLTEAEAEKVRRILGE